MAGLIHDTRKGSTPNGKPRVYFCAHPDDQEKYYAEISGEILKKQNLSIWRLEDPRAEIDLEAHLEELDDMQLFVVPVTAKLLESANRAIDAEIPFALAKNIQILPILYDNDVVGAFNDRCGNRQCLDKLSKDTSAISYDKKLGDFLSSRLIGDEQVEKVRNAFFAKVFLSYRKKDRKYAKELMRLIHESEECRDVGIWYDEFLIPGENFDDGIREALKESDVFAVAVTPNIVNEENYVLSTELPIAKELEKPILSAEMVSTDRNDFGENAIDLRDQLIDAHTETLSGVLLEKIQEAAISDKPTGPKHDLYIGLAYLYGINMEVNHERAIALITSAAEADDTEAIEKLIDIYQNGIGVARDSHEAAKWLGRFLDILAMRLSESHLEEDAIRFFEVVYRWCDNALATGDYETARSIVEGNLELARFMASNFEDEVSTFVLAEMLNWQAGFLRDDGELKRAREIFNEAIELLLTIREGEHAKEVCCALSDIYTDLSTLAGKEGKDDEASEFCEKSYNVLKEVEALFDGAPAYLYVCACSCTTVLMNFAVAHDEKNIELWGEKLRELIDALVAAGEEHLALDIQANYATARALASSEENEKTNYLKQALEARRRFALKHNDVISMIGVAGICYDLADHLTNFGKLSDAKPYYEEGIAICEKLRSDGANARIIATGMSRGLRSLGKLFCDEKNFSAAIENLEASVAVLPTSNGEEKNIIEARFEAHMNLMILYQMPECTDFSRSYAHLNTVLELKEKLPEYKLTKKENRAIAMTCNLMAADIREKEGFTVEFERTLLKALEFYLETLAEEDTTEIRNQISCVYDILASMYILRARIQEKLGKLGKRAAKKYYDDSADFRKLAEQYKK